MEEKIFFQMNPLPLGRCSIRTDSNQCHRWAKTHCSHCFQPICFQHEEFHLNSKNNKKSLEEVFKKKNDLKEKISLLNKENFIEKSKEKLRLWKSKEIDSIESKSNEIFDEILKRIENISFEQIRSNLLEQIDSNLNETFENHLENLQNQIDEIYRSIDLFSNGFESRC